MPFLLTKTRDFAVTGDGSYPGWNEAQAYALTKVGGEHSFSTSVKGMYSETGLYFFMQCEASGLHCDFEEDMADLYEQDVLEIFLQPQADRSVYLEYEISPLDKELPLMVSNMAGPFCGWLPFHYTGGRRVRHKTAVYGGEKAPHAPVQAWSAEVFIPFALFEGVLPNIPQEGQQWRGNVFRIDYTGGQPSRMALFPECGVEFHDYEKFGAMIFA